MSDWLQQNVQGDLPPNLANTIDVGINGYFGSQAVKYAAQSKVNPANTGMLVIGLVVVIGLVLYMRK